jgi:aminoglycoside 6'-N-acetyltransferase
MSKIDFRPLVDSDLALIRTWLEMPHVAEWWGDADEELGLIQSDRTNPAMEHFLILVDGKPAGFIQCYDTFTWDFPLGVPEGSRGIDLFIGEPDLVGRGIGTSVLTAFAKRLFDSGVPEIVIDPDPANLRAIRAYEKAGFVRRAEVDNPPWGPALIMSRRRS